MKIDKSEYRQYLLRDFIRYFNVENVQQNYDINGNLIGIIANEHSIEL